MSTRQEWPATVTAAEIAAHMIAHVEEQAAVMGDVQPQCRYQALDKHFDPIEGCTCVAGSLLTLEELTRVGHRTGYNTTSFDKLQGLMPARLRPHASLITQAQACYDSARTLAEAADSVRRSLTAAMGVAA